MAKISSTCDLMQNVFPAGSISLQGKFFVAQDLHGEPMIFSIDKSENLCLIAKGLDGHNELINLSTSFGLANSSKITALAVTQSQQSLIHLAFAISRDDGCDDLIVVKPMLAQRTAWTDESALRLAIYSGKLSDVAISDILMGNGNDRVDVEYPQLYLTVKLAGRSTEDIWSVTVTNGTASWVRQDQFQMPCNPGQIISKCIGNIGNRNPDYKANYRGLFILYKEVPESASLQLRFVGLDFALSPPTLQSFKQPVPPGAQMISSFDNPEGWTDLIVYADTILWRSSVDCFTQSRNPFKKPTSLFGTVDDVDPRATRTAKLKQMSIAQDKNTISIWTLDEECLLSYQEFEIFLKATKSPPQALSPPIPLISQTSDNDRFAAIYNPKLGQKIFIINSDGSTMSMLQQSTETRIWQSPNNIMIPDSDEIKEFASYTIVIQAEDDTSKPLLNQNFMLCASVSSEMMVNGVFIRGSPGGVVVKTDEQGLLTVILPGDGLAAPLLTLKDVPETALLGGRTFTVDPMQKLWDQMAQVKTVSDLLALTLPDGSRFVREGLDLKDYEKALAGIQDLLRARDSIAHAGQISSIASPASADHHWGAWLWVEKSINDAYEWTVDKVGKAWKFVVRVAGQVWEFIVENFPQVAAALQKVLETISKGWQWVKQKFEVIFPWNDILLVKNALANITTAGLILGSDVFSSLESKTDDYFQHLRKQVRDLKEKRLPKELTGIEFSEKPTSPSGTENEKFEAFLKSPQAQFGAYHLRHSGDKRESGVLPPRASDDTTFGRLYKRLSGIIDSLTTLAVRFGVNIVDLFSDKRFSLQDLLLKVGLDLADDALGVMQRTVTAILGSFSDLLLELVDAMNGDINIPVIGPLYKSLTHGARLTTLDVVCLLLAIPSTLAYKAFIGPLPKEENGFQQLTTHDVLKGALDLRIGRVKEHAPSDGPASGPSTDRVGEYHVTNTAASISPKMGTSYGSRETSPWLQLSSMSTSSGKSQAGSDQLQGDLGDKALSQKAFSWWIDVGEVGAKILQIALPICAVSYTCGYKLPKAMALGNADSQSSGSLISKEYYKGQTKSSTKMVFKLVFWLGHGMAICRPKLRAIKDWSKDFGPAVEAAFDDIVFSHKFLIWSTGLIPITWHLTNEYVGYCAEAAVGVAQTIMLVIMHVDIYAVSHVSYPWYRCPEEYINALSKVAVAGAVLMQGKEPWTLGFAFGLTSVGKTWTLARVADNMAEGKEVDPIAIDNTV